MNRQKKTKTTYYCQACGNILEPKELDTYDIGSGSGSGYGDGSGELDIEILK